MNNFEQHELGFQAPTEPICACAANLSLPSLLTVANMFVALRRHVHPERRTFRFGHGRKAIGFAIVFDSFDGLWSCDRHKQRIR